MNRSLLRHPAVIGGVAVGLVVIAVLNFQTFAAGSWFGSGGGDQGADHLVPPSDLDDVVKDALRSGTRDPGLALAGSVGGPAVTRDPFTGGVATAPVAAREPEASPRPRPSAPRPLVCTAVMLGGESPLALVNGEAYRVGDRLRGQEIVAIETDGVTLLRDDGRQTVLAVGPPRDGDSGYHVVTETLTDEDQGSTRLAGDSSERTDR
ncbi:hypothetical protein GF314_16945 [bacterium]|nr:hypothetical protein [bacterium]